MCGLVGALTDLAVLPALEASTLERMRDRAWERGPDAGGLHLEGPLALGHRRLAVVGLGEDGAQPALGPTWVLAYNGELYDLDGLRERLLAAGHRPPAERGDTALLLAALEAFGEEVLGSLRGMFALAAWHRPSGRLLLARDGLGVKPLYVWRGPHELVFASDVRSLLAHPRVPVRPDLEGVSAYLTTLRSTRPAGTLFEGVRMLEPGTRLVARITGGALQVDEAPFHAGRPVDPTWTEADAAEALRAALEDSVARQRLAEVPVCALLSGGLDSSSIVSLARAGAGRLRTYAAGTPGHGGDLEQARVVAAELGTDHAEACLDGPGFLHGWRELITRGGLPLSTPNEVAILEVCRRLREDDCVVTLSGEGADELLGGYTAVLDACRVYEEGDAGAALPPGRFHWEIGSWVGTAAKAELLDPAVLAATDGDATVLDDLERSFARCREEAGPEADALDAHLRFQRRHNLTCLLERLDRSSMLASVEGRVPFADQRLLDLCESFSAGLRYPVEEAPSPPAGSTATATLPRSKRVLRRAVQDLVSSEVLVRPKASFPLPFQDWLRPAVEGLDASPFAAALLRPEAIQLLQESPAQRWNLAWPLVNLALWGDRWFS